MKKNHLKQNSFAVLAALLWGTSFVAQSMGAAYLEPFTFNAARSLIGFLILLLLCLALRRMRRSAALDEPTDAPDSIRRDGKRYWRELALGGFCCGGAMTLAANLQQKGIETTTAGKAGFITALYIVIVPVLGIFLRKRIPWTVWISVGIAVCGLYFLCMQEGFSIAEGDFYIFLCSLFYSAQILLIDHFTDRVDGVELSCAQMLAVTLFSSAGMLAVESPAWEAVGQAIGPILYVGILSSGVAYTLQILAQKDSNPTVVSLLLSLESVFATVAGALVLHDRMSGRETFGCVLMLLAVVLAQLPPPKRKRAAQ